MSDSPGRSEEAAFDEVLTGSRSPVGALPTGVRDDTVVPLFRPGSQPLHRCTSKRVVDIVLALVVAIVLAPLVIGVAAAVWFSSPGPVLFRQVRVGADGRSFRVLKFRTMQQDAEAALRANPLLYTKYLQNDHKLEPHEDPRITSIGRFLRASSLDELPQLWNILLGHMSLVGPRPLVPTELEMYGRHADVYKSARPGMTGLWQVSGRSRIRSRERVALDVAYVTDWSLRRDATILLRTFGAVLRRDGAY